MRRIPTTALAASLVALAAAAPAHAGFQQVFADYKDDGTIDACRYTDAELAAVQVPPDIEQYAPNFVEALAAAREKRASGACDPKPKKADPEPAAVVPAPTEKPRKKQDEPAAAEVPAPPAPATPVKRVLASNVTAPPAAPALAAARGSEAPASVWILGVLAALTATAGLLALLSWWRGWDYERFTRPVGAAAGEASGRAADLAGEFWDWLRLGR